MRYKTENRRAICLRVKKRYRSNKAVRDARNAYKRLWRKANPDKVKRQKRREALRQNPHLYEYHRQYRATHPTKAIEARTCQTCPIPVSGRTKKCTGCKERERMAAIEALAPVRGRGKRTDLERAA